MSPERTISTEKKFYYLATQQILSSYVFEQRKVEYDVEKCENVLFCNSSVNFVKLIFIHLRKFNEFYGSFFHWFCYIYPRKIFNEWQKPLHNAFLGESPTRCITITVWKIYKRKFYCNETMSSMCIKAIKWSCKRQRF